MKKEMKEKLKKHEIGNKFVQALVNLAVFEGYKIVKNVSKRIAKKTNRLMNKIGVDEDDDY